MARIMGIDPGTKGALAILDTVACSATVIDMPLEAGVKGKTKVSSRGLIEAIRASDPDSVFVEDVAASPQMGVVSAFSFGDGFGCTRTAVQAHDIALWLVKPTVWKPVMKAPKDKKQATTRASQLFPSCHKILFGPRGGAFDGRAEALLLALYGVMTLKEPLTRPFTLIDWPEPA